MGEGNGMNELDLSKAVEAGAREMLLYDYPDALDDIDKPGDPCNLAGYNNSFHSGLTAALPDVLDAYAAKAYNDAMAMSHGYMEGDYETPKAAWEWLRAEAARLREGSNG